MLRKEVLVLSFKSLVKAVRSIAAVSAVSNIFSLTVFSVTLAFGILPISALFLSQAAYMSVYSFSSAYFALVKKSNNQIYFFYAGLTALFSCSALIASFFISYFSPQILVFAVVSGTINFILAYMGNALFARRYFRATN